MSSPIIVPFNFQPNQNITTTSSYTVPAGKYARLVDSFVQVTRFAGNSVTSTLSHRSEAHINNLPLADIYQLALQSINSATSITLENIDSLFDYTFWGQGNASKAANFNISTALGGTSNIDSFTTTSQVFRQGVSASSILLSFGGGSFGTQNSYANIGIKRSRPTNPWLKSGTIIFFGSFTSGIVSLDIYNEIS
jgi:hypothetical protein